MQVFYHGTTNGKLGITAYEYLRYGNVVITNIGEGGAIEYLYNELSSYDADILSNLLNEGE